MWVVPTADICSHNCYICMKYVAFPKERNTPLYSTSRCTYKIQASIMCKKEKGWAISLYDSYSQMSQGIFIYRVENKAVFYWWHYLNIRMYIFYILIKRDN